VEEAAQLERDIIAGSTAEVPMDIDEEVEDGEIADEEPAPQPARPSLPPRAPSFPSTSQPTAPRGGVKRPAAEDLMDNNARPIHASRAAPRKRRAFGGPTKKSFLSFPLDLSDSESDEETKPKPPPFEAPIIPIPSPYDTATLLAEKEEKIRQLKEQIAAKLAAQKANLGGAARSGTSTPSIAARVEAAAKAADQVGVEGVADDVVEAAVLAAADEQQAQHQKAVGEQQTQHQEAVDEQRIQHKDEKPSNGKLLEDER